MPGQHCQASLKAATIQVERWIVGISRSSVDIFRWRIFVHPFTVHQRFSGGNCGLIWENFPKVEDKHGQTELQVEPRSVLGRRRHTPDFINMEAI